ncbi:MAG: molecular chaperone DnaJ [Synechococcus sp.]|nr:molecular chaperone DnaJ [Synechococcus sp.]
MGESASGERRRISLELPVELVEQIDGLRGEWGLRSRGDILVRLLQGLFEEEAGVGALEDDGADLSPAPAGCVAGLEEAERNPSTGIAELPLDDVGLEEPGDLEAGGDQELSTALDERGALVLIRRSGAALDTLPGSGGERARRAPDAGTPSPAASGSAGGGGIDLPGFVRRRSDQLRRSLRVRPGSLQPDESLPTIPSETLEGALATASQHWLDLYGSAPSETVLEAAMVWLAQDIWPQSDQSEGRPFTWSLASELVRGFAPSWGEAAASFERVMVMAGLLEDPFSGATLDLRIPTLIRRFVHRFRRRRPGTSFLTLEHTMSLHGALKLLQLPTAPGHRFTLAQIREAYREMALKHHPDSGGSVDAMRRLNEAYHLLKELYR